MTRYAEWVAPDIMLDPRVADGGAEYWVAVVEVDRLCQAEARRAVERARTALAGDPREVGAVEVRTASRRVKAERARLAR